VGLNVEPRQMEVGALIVIVGGDLIVIIAVSILA
jgi:hypothetical protein